MVKASTEQIWQYSITFTNNDERLTTRRFSDKKINVKKRTYQITRASINSIRWMKYIGCSKSVHSITSLRHSLYFPKQNRHSNSMISIPLYLLASSSSHLPISPVRLRIIQVMMPFTVIFPSTVELCHGDIF